MAEIETSESQKPAPVALQPVVGRCVCKQDRTVTQIGCWEGCPLEGGGHTAFALQRCHTCGKVSAFPDSNLDIALERGTERTKGKLRELMLENLIQILGAALDHQNETWGLYGNESKLALKVFKEWKASSSNAESSGASDASAATIG